jgi:AMMECR1 domain-containing protein
LIAELGHRRGLLLPQVATEKGWGREEFAGHTCRKAGLPTDAWRTGARLFKFEAEVFGDQS